MNKSKMVNSQQVRGWLACFVLSFVVCQGGAKAGSWQQNVSGQVDFQNWLDNTIYEYGFSFGLYLPNNYTANYYNGGSPVHSLNDKIGKDPYTGCLCVYNYSHNEIEEEIGGYEFDLKELPLSMRYKKPLSLGFYGSMHIASRTTLYAELNYAKLETVDYFSIETENAPYGSYVPDNVLFFPMKGVEKRYDINLGLLRLLGRPDAVMPFIEAGFNLNNTDVQSAEINIGNLVYSYRNSELDYYNYRDYGVGIGWLAGGGAQFVLAPRFNVQAGFNLSLKNIRLGDFRHANYASVSAADQVRVYDQYKLHGLIYLRLLFKQVNWEMMDVER